MLVRPVIAALFALLPFLARADEATVEVDTSALVYYARSGDRTRVDAEIRRLRSLHPGWEPPAEIGRPAQNLQPLWDLYGADRLDELDRELSRLAADPGFVLPSDLAGKITAKKARRKTLAAAEAGDWPAVLAAIEASPALKAEPDVELTWRLAEAEARLGRAVAALDLYRRILAGPATPAERAATARKAVALLPAAEAEAVLALGRRGPDGGEEFAAARLDRIRNAVGAHLSAGSPLPDEPALATLAAEARRSGEAGDRKLLGWLELKRGRAAEAEAWFATARPAGEPSAPDAEAVAGRVLALARLGRREEALKLAEASTGGGADRPASAATDRVAEIYVGLVAGLLATAAPGSVSTERLARFAEIVRRLAAADGAAALGWYAYRSRQSATAAAWFDRALDWKPDAKALEGRLRAAALAGDADAAPGLAARWGDRFPDVFAGLAAERARETSDRRRVARPAATRSRLDPARPTDCVDTAARLRAAGRLSAEEARLEGWCLLALDRDAEAARAFATRSDLAGPARSDAAYGEAIARLRRGETAAALTASREEGLAPARREEIAAAALAQQAVTASRAESWTAVLAALDRRRGLVAETRDLAVLRGWALRGLGRRDEAHALFRRLDAALSTRETRQGLAWTDPFGASGR